jgi:imidazolonepropionase-like amidohydrolase
VSDNPVLNSQHVVFEAAKAYGYGLPYHVALAGVTSAPAELLGMGERIGKIVEGFDADIVVWDSDPLSAGATPVQVWIDGAPSFKDPVELEKPIAPPLTPDLSLGKDLEKSEMKNSVIFTGITNVHLDSTTKTYSTTDKAVAIIANGILSCIGPCAAELAIAQTANTPTFALKNGHITPPFTAFGSSLGLVEIDAEKDTHDGPPPSDSITRAIDGLSFGGKQLTTAYEHGVTNAITAPSTGSIDAKGVSVGFKTGAKHKLEKGAIWADEVALHYVLTLTAKGGQTPSISSVISQIRGKLLTAVDDLASNSTSTSTAKKDVYDEKKYLERVVAGSLPLVFTAHSADTIASIISLKSEIETARTALPASVTTSKLNIIILGGAESHLLASEIASAKISIVLAPLLPHAQTWDQRRGLTGAPLTNGTAIDALLAAGVLVGIGVEELWETRDLGLLAGIAFANSGGKLSFKEALDLAGGNFAEMLGTGRKSGDVEDWVVWEGSPLEIGGRVRAVRGVGSVVVWD